MTTYNNPLVSVIIPVYNAQDYLEKCIKTVRNQTYTNLEIILVNDGSTDNSGKMCDEYAKEDVRIRVIHKVNGGQSEARNKALDIAQGKYITFVDADDYVDTRLVERLLMYLLDNECDIAVSGTVKTIIEKEDTRNDLWEVNYEVIERRDAFNRFFYRRSFPGYVCAKLFRADVFAEIRFPVGKIFEDPITLYHVMKNVDKVGVLDYPMYYYRQNPQSTVHIAYKSSRLNQVYFALDMLEDVKGDEELRAAAETYLFFALMDNYALVDKDHADDRRFLEKNIRKYRGGVLKNKQEGLALRIMALVACFPGLWMARILGKVYKRMSWKKWKKEIKRNS